MPQISASIGKDTIKAINTIVKETPRLSFSGAVDMLLATHPKVITELNKSSKPKK